jgi:hypothetical protein
MSDCTSMQELEQNEFYEKSSLLRGSVSRASFALHTQGEARYWPSRVKRRHSPGVIPSRRRTHAGMPVRIDIQPT